MRKRWISIGMAWCLVLVFSSLGWAAGRIGVIDLALVMDQSKAGKQANVLLAEFVEEKQQELLPMEGQLEQLAALLDGEDATDEEREARQAEWAALVEEYNGAFRQIEAEIDAVLHELRNQLLTDIGAVLQRVGDSRGFDLIIDAEAAYYYRRTVDLTFEVLREYDDLWEAAARPAPEGLP